MAMVWWISGSVDWGRQSSVALASGVSPWGSRRPDGRVTRVPKAPSVSQPIAMSVRSWSRVRVSPLACSARAVRSRLRYADGGGRCVGAHVQLGREVRLRVEDDPTLVGRWRAFSRSASGSSSATSRRTMARSRPEPATRRCGRRGAAPGSVRGRCRRSDRAAGSRRGRSRRRRASRRVRGRR